MGDVIIIDREEHLRLVDVPGERVGVNDPICIPRVPGPHIILWFGSSTISMIVLRSVWREIRILPGSDILLDSPLQFGVHLILILIHLVIPPVQANQDDSIEYIYTRDGGVKQSARLHRARYSLDIVPYATRGIIPN